MEKHRTTEFVIPQNKSTLLKEKVGRVYSLFGVDVTLTHNLPSSEIQWVCIKGSNEKLCSKAKTYITSLCGNDSVRHCVNLEIPGPLFDDLKSGSGGKDVEKLAGAVLSFSDSKVFVQGDEFVIAMAESEIERRIAAFKNENEFDITKPCVDSDDPVHDSVENIPERSSVTINTDIAPSMREFAHKLNYTDREIDAVIRTFGTEININQLLQELVKNSTTTLQLSSASEDTNLFPVARGSCDISRLTTRVLHPRGAPLTISNRVPADVEADYHVEPFPVNNLRPIVIDGSNVAMSHGNQQVFSCRGIKLCVEYFKRRGHDDITVFVPMWRNQEPRPENAIADREILDELYKQNVLKFTPSRKSGNRLIVCYDDKFIVDLADQNGGIIVSNDGFRDLIKENPRWRETIEQRTLMYTFAGDHFMPPDDPLGRKGPSLDDFLKKGSVTHPKICPYLKNCTFGNRCKYYHPERDTQRQQEKVVVRIPPENSETPKASPAVTTSSPTCPSTSTSTNGVDLRNTVGDPRVCISTPVVQRSCQSISSSANETHTRNIVRDLRVRSPTFQSYFEHHGQSDGIIARGSRQVGAASYDQARIQSGEEYYQWPYYSETIYGDYRNPVPSDYTARNIQYQDPSPLYHHDVRRFAPLSPSQWSLYNPQYPYPQPSGIGYPAGAGQYTYMQYFEPAQVSYRNYQGQGSQPDQIDSVKSGESFSRKENFEKLVEELKNVFKEIDEDVIIGVLREHPQDCADHNINKLAELLLEVIALKT